MRWCDHPGCPNVIADNRKLCEGHRRYPERYSPRWRPEIQISCLRCGRPGRPLCGAHYQLARRLRAETFDSTLSAHEIKQQIRRADLDPAGNDEILEGLTSGRRRLTIPKTAT